MTAFLNVVIRAERPRLCFSAASVAAGGRVVEAICGSRAVTQKLRLRRTIVSGHDFSRADRLFVFFEPASAGGTPGFTRL